MYAVLPLSLAEADAWALRLLAGTPVYRHVLERVLAAGVFREVYVVCDRPAVLRAVPRGVRVSAGLPETGLPGVWRGVDAAARAAGELGAGEHEPMAVVFCDLPLLSVERWQGMARRWHESDRRVRITARACRVHPAQTFRTGGIVRLETVGTDRTELELADLPETHGPAVLAVLVQAWGADGLPLAASRWLRLQDGVPQPVPGTGAADPAYLGLEAQWLGGRLTLRWSPHAEARDYRVLVLREDGRATDFPYPFEVEGLWRHDPLTGTPWNCLTGRHVRGRQDLPALLELARGAVFLLAGQGGGLERLVKERTFSAEILDPAESVDVRDLAGLLRAEVLLQGEVAHGA